MFFLTGWGSWEEAIWKAGTEEWALCVAGGYLGAGLTAQGVRPGPTDSEASRVSQLPELG